MVPWGNEAALSGFSVFGAVWLASLLGSTHCLGMCGGLVVAVVRDRKSAIQYHMARGIAYLTLGGLVGGLGRGIALAPWTELRVAASLFVALTFVLMGTRLLLGRSPDVPGSSALRRITQQWASSWVKRGPMGVGFASALLPCGWLHAFVLATATLGSWQRGVLAMSAFWLGTLPILLFGPFVVRKAILTRSGLTQRLAGVLLILAAIFVVGWKADSLWPAPTTRPMADPPTCHYPA